MADELNADLKRESLGLHVSKQVLLYPCIFDEVQFASDMDKYILSEEIASACIQLYLSCGNDEIKHFMRDRRIQPLKDLENCSRLPQTSIVLGTEDSLHDAVVEYVHQLMEIGASVRLRKFHGAVHGFACMSFLPQSGEAFEFILEELQADVCRCQDQFSSLRGLDIR